MRQRVQPTRISRTAKETQPRSSSSSSDMSSKVAECGSITEASRRLFVSQPSITARRFGDLENEMGVHIFERTNKGVIVSEEGETFLGYARQVLDRADLLEGKCKGRIRAGAALFGVSCQHYSFAVNRVCRRDPRVRCRALRLYPARGADSRDYRGCRA